MTVEQQAPAQRSAPAGPATPAECPTTADPEVDAAAGLLRVLGAPVRLALLVELAAGSRCVHELVDALYDAGRPVSQPLVSQHLRVLRTSGLVTATRDGHEVVYALADEHVGHVVRDALSHARHAGQPDSDRSSIDPPPGQHQTTDER